MIITGVLEVRVPPQVVVSEYFTSTLYPVISGDSVILRHANVVTATEGNKYGIDTAGDTVTLNTPSLAGNMWVSVINSTSGDTVTLNTPSLAGNMWVSVINSTSGDTVTLNTPSLAGNMWVSVVNVDSFSDTIALTTPSLSGSLTLI